MTLLLEWTTQDTCNKVNYLSINLIFFVRPLHHKPGKAHLPIKARFSYWSYQ